MFVLELTAQHAMGYIRIDVDVIVIVSYSSTIYVFQQTIGT